MYAQAAQSVRPVESTDRLVGNFRNIMRFAPYDKSNSPSWATLHYHFLHWTRFHPAGKLVGAD
jgi:hypothetical protein